MPCTVWEDLQYLRLIACMTSVVRGQVLTLQSEDSCLAAPMTRDSRGKMEWLGALTIPKVPLSYLTSVDFLQIPIRTYRAERY